MPATPLTDEQCREALRALAECNTHDEACLLLGLKSRGALEGRLRAAKLRGLTQDPAIQEAMKSIGTNMVPSLAWVKQSPEGKISHSVLLKPGKDLTDFLGQIRDNINELHEAKPPNLPKRFKERTGNMLVLDPADVHIGKLCVATETGYEYNTEIAEHRLVEGCMALLERGAANGCTSVTFVIGNDVSHIDTPKRTTTSGTPQDTDGSLFTIFRAAQKSYVRVVEMCLEMGLPVRIVFCPSNHDWLLGYTIAQTVGSWFRGHKNVTATEYGLSENHRKYLRFGSNLIGFSHGDGAKEGDLSSIMLTEARQHIADCPHRYFYLHHYHHKIRKTQGMRSQAREKDHTGMTVIQGGAGQMESDNLSIEYVRSPSAPDGWHHRNGYLNRQAVEAFIHHPRDGQIMRLTEWF